MMMDRTVEFRLTGEDKTYSHGEEIGIGSKDLGMQWKIFEEEIFHGETDQ